MKTALRAAVALFLAACASAPAQTPPPAWVTQATGTVGNDKFFVASGSSSSGSITEAEQNAANNLMNMIMTELGVRVTSDTTTEVQATVDQFRASLRSSVTATGSAQISGYRLGDRYVLNRSGGAVEVFLRGLYDAASFNTEQARLRALFQQKIDAVQVPEREGDASLQRGQVVTALTRYAQGAAAASSSDIDNARIWFEELMTKATNAVTSLSLVALTDRQTTTVGAGFSQPFRVRLVRGNAETGTPVADTNLIFSYRRRAGRNTVVATQAVRTGADGVASFNHPVPDFASSGNVAVTLDLSAVLEPLNGVPQAYQGYVAAFQESAARVRANLAYVVESNAKNIPTSIAILDLDANGAQTGAQAQTAVMAALSGFRVTTLAGVQASQLQGDPATVLGSLRSRLPAGTQRVVFGQVNILDVSGSGTVTVRLSASIQAVEVATGEVLHSANLTKRAVGSNQASALSSALRQIGEDIGKSLADNLP